VCSPIERRAYLWRYIAQSEEGEAERLVKGKKREAPEKDQSEGFNWSVFTKEGFYKRRKRRT